MFFITLAGIIFPGFHYLFHDSKLAFISLKISDNVGFGESMAITN
jgi:hypothetical protein